MADPEKCGGSRWAAQLKKLKTFLRFDHGGMIDSYTECWPAYHSFLLMFGHAAVGYVQAKLTRSNRCTAKSNYTNLLFTNRDDSAQTEREKRAIISSGVARNLSRGGRKSEGVWGTEIPRGSGAEPRWEV